MQVGSSTSALLNIATMHIQAGRSAQTSQAKGLEGSASEEVSESAAIEAGESGGNKVSGAGINVLA